MPFFDSINNFVGDAAAAAAQAAAQAAASIPGPASTGAAGTLRIEPDQVDNAIEVFQGALDKLEWRVRLAVERVEALPMAADGVSEPAAAAFNHASLSGKGAAVAAWMGAVKELRSIIEQLNAQKVANVRTDDAVAQSFTSASGMVS